MPPAAHNLPHGEGIRELDYFARRPLPHKISDEQIKFESSKHWLMAHVYVHLLAQGRPRPQRRAARLVYFEDEPGRQSAGITAARRPTWGTPKKRKS
jgi:hypothetical protein